MSCEIIVLENRVIAIIFGQLVISKELGYIDVKQLYDLSVKIEELYNKLNSLRNYQLNKLTSHNLI